MSKADSNQIRRYYSKSEIVSSYDKRRFSGVGGQYIQKNEIDSNIQLLKIAFKPSQSICVLDVGAGSGRLSKFIEKAGYNLFCLDSSSEMVKLLRILLPKEKILIQSAFDKVNISKKFDAMTALRFFDHFGIGNQRKLLKNLKINLKSNGYIIFSCLNKNSSEYFLSKLFYFGKVNFYYLDSKYRSLFESLGMEVIERNQKFFIPRGTFLYAQKILPVAKLLIRIDKLLSKLFPDYCSSFVYLLKTK